MQEASSIEIDRTSPFGLWNYSANYIRAADALIQRDDTSFDSPIRYLLGHAIELSLKACLRGSGLADEDVHTHDFIVLYQRSTQHGFPHLSQDEVECLTLMDAYHIEFRYIKTGYKELPRLEDSLSLANKIHSLAKAYVRLDDWKIIK